jgi:class 3 adenylate cyclase
MAFPIGVVLFNRCWTVDPDCPRGVKMDVADWLHTLNLGQYEATFRENSVGMDVLPSLTVDDLKDLGVTAIGDRRRLLNAIAALRPTEGAIAQNTQEPAAERRQLSVMFCDIAGSTALSTRLDPEDLSTVMRAYQATVRSIISRFGGFIARYVGDGVLIYFGWPEAHETDAESAVRAALAVIAAVNEGPIHGEHLGVRIGIATGLVVVGSPIGEGDARQQTAIGETPNRAARLQGLARPNDVIIDVTTRRQVGELFECSDFGPVELKGLPEPIRAWSVNGERAVESRFAALRPSQLASIVGRAEELELLARRWERAKAEEGQVVLLSGEAGIGKSRLTAALRDQIGREPHSWMSYFCSPHHQDSALHPVIVQFGRAAGFLRTDTDEARWAKLEALLAPTALSTGDVTLLGNLLSLSRRDSRELPDISPGQQRRRTLEALLHHVTSLARQLPVVVSFEDVHWADPSSGDLLDRLISEIPKHQVFLVLTFRPEFQAPWAGLAHVATLLLNRLDRRESATLVRQIGSPDRSLPTDIVEEIVSKTDGVPLFLEELTRAALDAETVPGSVPDMLAAVPRASSGVPASLHASLMPRLDRLGSDAREVAQIGAVIGREFEYELLAAAVGWDETRLQRALDLLTEAGLVLRRGMPPAASFLFKHALVQDVAYGTLLRARRRQLHAVIGRALADHFPEQRETQPELLARHFTEAAQPAQAVDYWLLAGQRSAEHSADREAIRQLQRGLDILMTLPASANRDRLELAFHLTLATPLASVHHYAAPPAVAAYERASVLCERLDDAEGLLMSLFRPGRSASGPR